MSLKEKINIDLKSAMLEKRAEELEVLRAIRAEILKMDKSGLNREMDEDEEIQLLNKQVKLRKEAIEMAEKAGRNDIAEKEKKQIDILQKYLPEQMSKEDAEKIIEKIISEVGAVSAKDKGKVMGSVMKELKGKIDGTLVQQIVSEKLPA
ncbi:MAG TPA: GatB/YqeY domain-containing protein [Ignavibacteria bacterium]|nr:GatB/YqeY domain-containing protein [Ignavibacteria bacterium]